MKVNKTLFKALRDERLAMKTPGYWVMLLASQFIAILMGISLANQVQDPQMFAVPYRMMAMI
jgi:hypothetical protein